MSISHKWSDNKFDWNGLNDSLEIIRRVCLYARLGTHIKEKYGRARVSTWFFDGSLHSFLYPGYVYCQYTKRFGIRKRLWYCDIYVFPKISKYTGITKLIQFIQKKVYNLAYQTALKKYPHLRDEILVDADYPELITGGMEVHDRFWTRVEYDE